MSGSILQVIMGSLVHFSHICEHQINSSTNKTVFGSLKLPNNTSYRQANAEARGYWVFKICFNRVFIVLEIALKHDSITYAGELRIKTACVWLCLSSWIYYSTYNCIFRRNFSKSLNYPEKEILKESFLSTKSIQKLLFIKSFCLCEKRGRAG